MSLEDYAKNELEKAGLFDKDSDYCDQVINKIMKKGNK